MQGLWKWGRTVTVTDFEWVSFCFVSLDEDPGLKVRDKACLLPKEVANTV